MSQTLCLPISTYNAIGTNWPRPTDIIPRAQHAPLQCTQMHTQTVKVSGAAIGPRWDVRPAARAELTTHGCWGGGMFRCEARAGRTPSHFCACRVDDCARPLAWPEWSHPLSLSSAYRRQRRTGSKILILSADKLVKVSARIWHKTVCLLDESALNGKSLRPLELLPPYALLFRPPVHPSKESVTYKQRICWCYTRLLKFILKNSY